MSSFEGWLSDSDKQFKILYGILGFLLIPVFAILFSFPVRGVIWLIAMLPFVPIDAYLGYVSIGISYVVAVYAYFYIWRLWKRRNGRS